MAAERASDLAYERVLERILDLRLPPGTFVNEQSLAADLGLGRMPVREALARLATDRLITVLPRRGTVVTPLGLTDVLDMFEAREAIECGVAHIAANRAGPEDLATLRSLISTADGRRDSVEYEEFLHADHEVHRFLVHMVGNPLLQDAADRLLLHSIRFWRSYWASRPPRIEAMMSHADLLRALESHDPEQAEKAMREHLRTSCQLVQHLFGPRTRPLPRQEI
jgi:DNA-binding GntR family transcriptional regulator